MWFNAVTTAMPAFSGSYYLEVLRVALERYRVQLHAYVLMTNHVHLLLTPECSAGISRVMQHLGRMYVLYINKTYRRSGTLWEGRHKASLVDADNYLLSCYRYIELNPVVAGMVQRPEHYPWSSYHWHGRNQADPLITDHPLFEALGTDPRNRALRYREFINEQLLPTEIDQIRSTSQHGYPLGNERFKAQIESALGRSVGHLQPGKPSRRL